MNQLSDYVSYFNDVLTEKECKNIIKWYEDNISEESDAKVSSDTDYTDGEINQEVRNSKLISVPFESDIDLLLSGSVNKCLTNYIEALSTKVRFNETVNVASFFPTTLTSEQYYINKYYPNQFYDWHMDQGFDIGNLEIFSRFLSVLIYLNDDFEGGNTEFTFGYIEPKQGSCLVFPSNFLYSHRASPVLSGYKYSVAAWCAPRKNNE